MTNPDDNATIITAAPSKLQIVAPDGHPLLTITSDGEWIVDDADAPEAARVFLAEVKRLASRRPDAGDAAGSDVLSEVCTPLYGSCALLSGHRGPHHGYPEDIEAVVVARIAAAVADAEARVRAEVEGKVRAVLTEGHIISDYRGTFVAVEDVLAALSSPEAECHCPPCPGRGNDGHGLTHCAECCYGTGVEADLDCPIHGAPEADAPVPQRDAEHVVHVTAAPVAEDVVWCDECEEWVTSGAPESAVESHEERSSND